MGDSEDPIGINDKIEILSTDDQRIKAVGELLSSDSEAARGTSQRAVFFSDHIGMTQRLGGLPPKQAEWRFDSVRPCAAPPCGVNVRAY